MDHIQPKLVTLSELFQDRLFNVPEYQRAYSWEEKHRRALFDDILHSASHDNGGTHFMATIVGLRKGFEEIKPHRYSRVEIVDGQQRITTLILLYKAIEKALASVPGQEQNASEIQRRLVKPDNVSHLLLQTNHDGSDYFAQYIHSGVHPLSKKALTVADRELLRAMEDCEEFVDEWKRAKGDLISLVAHLNYQLTFILYEISDEALVYTVFEVLNSRGLDVSWLDRLKSMLMAIVFEAGNSPQAIGQIHQVWSDIYGIIRLRLGLSTEALGFAATLKLDTCPSRSLSEERAVEALREHSKRNAEKAIETARWLKRVTRAVHDLVEDNRKDGVTKTAQARLLAVAVMLRDNLTQDQRKEILRRWESVAFRIYGMCGKDARTGVGAFVRLSWRVVNEEISYDDILKGLADIGKDFPIDKAVDELRASNCYDVMDRDELRYLLFRYEQYLAEEEGQDFDNVQWNAIWEADPIDSIEHITPQSSERDHVHWLGNLLLLQPKLNSKLGKKSPHEKSPYYRDTGLFIARDVAKRIGETDEWGKEEVRAREDEILKWAKLQWGD